MGLEIDRLTTDDLDAAHRLSTQANWNQTAADWHRLLSLFPETCFAGRLGGELVATSSLAIYGGEVGWIGMVLVDESHRRQRYGSKLFERALEAAIDRNLDVIGLDATDAGCAVYRQYGFSKVGDIDRWSGALREGNSNADIATVRDNTLISEIDSFDRRHSGVDRRVFLEDMLAASNTTGFVCRHDGDVRGYAIVRPGRICPQIGPAVAINRGDIEALFSAISDQIDSVIIDVPRDGKTESTVEQHGLTVQRQLRRMTYEESQWALDNNTVVAAAGFEWG